LQGKKKNAIINSSKPPRADDVGMPRVEPARHQLTNSLQSQLFRCHLNNTFFFIRPPLPGLPLSPSPLRILRLLLLVPTRCAFRFTTLVSATLVSSVQAIR